MSELNVGPTALASERVLDGVNSEAAPAGWWWRAGSAPGAGGAGRAAPQVGHEGGQDGRLQPGGQAPRAAKPPAPRRCVVKVGAEVRAGQAGGGGAELGAVTSRLEAVGLNAFLGHKPEARGMQPGYAVQGAACRRAAGGGPKMAVSRSRRPAWCGRPRSRKPGPQCGSACVSVWPGSGHAAA